MVKEAEKFEDEDRTRVEEAQIRNEADSLVYAAEKTLADLGEKMGAEQRERVAAAVADLKGALAGKEMDAVRSATERLRTVLQEAGTTIYQGAVPSGGGEQVYDAEYRVKDEKQP